MQFALSGCVNRNQRNNQLDRDTFWVQFKADPSSSSGKKAAFYHDRIYYLSSELGTQGIYSMNPSGKDISLEVPVEDIRAIQLQDDVLYYSGFAGVKENDNGPYRQFRLFSLAKGDTVSKDFLASAVYSDDLRDKNVWDFYVSKSDTIVLRFSDVVGYDGRSELSGVTFKDNRAITFSGYQMINSGIVEHVDTVNKALLSFLRYADFYYVIGNYTSTYPEQDELLYGWDSISVYDSSQNQVALSIDRNYSSMSANGSFDFSRWICRIDGDTAIFASVRGLETFNMVSSASSDIVTFSTPECVYNQLDYGDYFLVFTECLRSSYLNGVHAPHTYPLNRALSESLYRVFPETKEKQLVLTVGKNQTFLYADRSVAAVAKGKQVLVYDISADQPKLIRTIDLNHQIVDRANKIDSAGGWLFLYRFNEKTQRDELIEKVQIGS
ncbi:MAG: hypothetical protein VB068_06940 [Petrimonas sp.]|nr:hypothetical protein [Petrimonas sp.]